MFYSSTVNLHRTLSYAFFSFQSKSGSDDILRAKQTTLNFIPMYTI